VVFEGLFFQYGFSIVVSFAGVDGKSFAQLDGLFELSAKDGALDVAGRVIVVVVETDFAPADTARRGHGLCAGDADVSIGQQS
jgi:hypothetical protein